MMPLGRYFVFVGGALMALLFAFDFVSPKAVAESGERSTGVIDKSTLRIKSEQKWPERIVFDTAQPTVVASRVSEVSAAPVAQALPGLQPASELTPQARVRETFAQFVAPEPKKADASTKKKRTAKASSGQPLRLARYGGFGTGTW